MCKMYCTKYVRIETGYIKNMWGLQIYIKIGGDCVGIAWGPTMINTLCGDGVGLPTQGFVELGAPHTIPTQGFSSGDCSGRICVGEWDRGVHFPEYTRNNLINKKVGPVKCVRTWCKMCQTSSNLEIFFKKMSRTSHDLPILKCLIPFCLILPLKFF